MPNEAKSVWSKYYFRLLEDDEAIIVFHCPVTCGAEMLRSRICTYELRFGFYQTLW